MPCRRSRISSFGWWLQFVLAHTGCSRIGCSVIWHSSALYISPVPNARSLKVAIWLRIRFHANKAGAAVPCLTSASLHTQAIVEFRQHPRTTVGRSSSSHGGSEALGEASIYLALTRLPRGASQLGLGVFTRYRRNLDQLMPRMSKRLHLPRLSLNTRTSNMRVNTMSLRVPPFWHAGSDWAAIGGNTSCQGPPLARPACAYFPPWRNFESQWIALNQCMAQQHWPRPTTSWKELAPPDKSAPGRRPWTSILPVE